MRREVAARRRAAAIVGVVAAVMALTLVWAPGAGAVLAHVGNGHVAGVAPIRGVNPASVPGSFAARVRRTMGLSSNGNLDYHGGPVLHASAPYLVFWDPSGTLTTTEKNLFERYFADVAHDSGSATDVYGVDRQFTDTSGFADYSQTWSSAQAITDTHAYPSTGQCGEKPSGVSTCLFDSQLQNEVQRLITADGLPSGYTGAAPIYFVVTPPTVNSCFSDGTTCADNFFCAYHSSATVSDTFLYADIPTYLAVADPKGCQADGNTAVQSPNGNSIADVAIKYMSHEDNETITDPLGNAWWDSNSGNEDGDNCDFAGSFDPAAGDNPDAFLPTLGGSAAAGTLYDQLINSDQYYIQSEWSNGNVNCEMRPATATLTPAFSAPAEAQPGTSVSFNPTASSSSAGISSVTWDFGDGSSPVFSTGAPTTVNHTFTSSGTYTVTLTEVDQYGNLQTVSHMISVATGPVAAFTHSPTYPLVSASVSFDGTGSTDDAGTISSYSWNWGDSTTAGTGSNPNHTYTAAGTYTVTLTVNDGTNTDMVSHLVKVDNPPTAAFGVTTPSPVAGSPTSFNGSGSGETGGSIASYSWNWGDGTTAGTGETPSHTYTAAGDYTVTLTVTDQDGHTASTHTSVPVVAAPVAAFGFSPTMPAPGVLVSFDGSVSSDPGGGTINQWNWNFGDGGTGTGETTSHTYAAGGSYTVTLTVTDTNTHTASTSHTVQVVGAPTAAFTITTQSPVLSLPVGFDGSASNQPGGAITQYSWSFGDGGTATGKTTSHTYASSGTYAVTLTVTGSDSETASVSQTVTIPPPLAGPVPGQPNARITIGSAHPVAGWAVPLSAVGSTDKGWNLIAWNWSFGDGTTGSGQTLSHRFPKPGTYRVTLTVADGSNASNTTTMIVKVASASITSVSVKKGTKVERLTLRISGPGRLIVGARRHSIEHPESFKLSVRLGQAQRNRLKHHHAVKVSVKLKFVPSVGTNSSRTVRITVKP